MRPDAWNENEDALLAETVIRHIREGSTQLNAFKEAAEKLQRSPAACGFRWNNFVRKKYEDDILQAKQQRQGSKKTRKRWNRKIQIQTAENKRSIDPVMASLNKIYDTYVEVKTGIEQLTLKLEQTQIALNKLHEEHAKLSNLAQHAKTLPEDDENYRTLLSIVEHANRLLRQYNNDDFAHEKTG
jgi:prespore-specific regulator